MRKRAIPLILLIGLLGSCAAVPTRELTAYRDSFETVRSSSVSMYTDLIPAIRLAQGQGEADAIPYRKTLGPAGYTNGSCGVTFGAYPDLDVRCQAITFAAAYSELLVRLANGESTRALRAQMSAVKGLLNGLLPLAAGTGAVPPLNAAIKALDPIGKIFDEIARLEDAAAVRARLNEGAPQIRGLLAALRDDVPRIYKIQRDYYVVLLDDVAVRFENASSDILSTAANHARPTDPKRLQELRDISQKFDEYYERTDFHDEGDRPDTVVGTSASKSFTAETLLSLSKGLGNMEAAVKDYETHRTLWQTFRAALMSYDETLNSATQAFEALVSASNNPLAPGGGTEQLIGALITVRGHATDLQETLNSN